MITLSRYALTLALQLRQCDVRADNAFLSELDGLLSWNAHGQKAMRKLVVILKAASALRASFCEHGRIEKLKGERNLYAIRIDVGTQALRVLFSIHGGNKILLCSFFEEKGHKHTSYQNHIPRAKARDICNVRFQRGEKR